MSEKKGWFLKLQQMVPQPQKAKESIARGGKKYKYAGLDDVMDVVRPSLAAVGCELYHERCLIDGRPFLKTTLTDGSDNHQDVVEIPQGMTPQEFGSWLTYQKRYAICGLLALVGEDDDDGGSAENSAHSKTAQPKSPQPTVRQRPQAPEAQKVENLPSPNINKKASGAQFRLIWARLHNDLRLVDDAAKNYIYKNTGKQSSKDLTMADVKKLLDCIDDDMGSAAEPDANTEEVNDDHSFGRF